jgi:O-antigen/teichoic acid export membrane protein
MLHALAGRTVRHPPSDVRATFGQRSGNSETCEMSQRAQRIIDAARKVPVPEGTYAVGFGLLIAGLTAYGFQILAFKALSKTEYAALNGLWICVFVVAPGFFLPLEQEVGRAVSDRRARNVGGGPVVRKAALAGALLTGGLIALTLVLAATTSLVDRLFHDQGVLTVCFVIALATYAVQHITRGTLSGNGRFGPYGMILAAEGVLRMAPVLILYLAGIDEIVWYGLALAIPPAIASAIALRGQRDLLAPGPEAEWSELSTHLTLLFLGSLAAQTLSYSAALAAIVLAKGPIERAEAADFIVGFFIARIPILLFQAIQAALLPKLAALSGAGKHDDFRSGLMKLIAIVIGIGALGVVAGATVGPIAGEILFGEKFHLDNRDLALLAAGSALFILALTLAQALIALRGHGRALVAWCIGLVLCVGVTIGSTDDLFLRVELGFLAGCAGAAAAMAALLVTRMRAESAESLGLLVDAIEHEPLEI